MPGEASARYRNWYAKLLRLYPKLYRERFAEPMEQTFADLLRERSNQGGELFCYAVSLFVEAFAAIVREQIQMRLMKNRNIVYLGILTAFILMIPLVAMQFTREVNWTGSDFAFAGTLIFGTGLLFEMTRKRGAGNRAYTVAAGMALAGVFLLIWINGAVGIIGSEKNSFNLLYLGVVGVAVIGSVLARLRPSGMARALCVTAAAQAIVPVIALVAQPDVIWAEPPGVSGVLVLNSLFVILFAGSALLFTYAGKARLTSQTSS
jgi:hypothetical protein